MDILAYNNSCSSFEMTKNNEKIKCDSEITNLLLEKNTEYVIKYYLKNYNYFSINFFNYKSEFIQSIDNQNKIKSLIALRNSIFNYSINIIENKINDYFGFIIDYPRKFSLEGEINFSFLYSFFPKLFLSTPEQLFLYVLIKKLFPQFINKLEFSSLFISTIGFKVWD